MLVLTSLALSATGFVLLAQAASDDIVPTQPKIPSRKFSLVDFGAVPDGKTSNSDAFRRAIAAVEKGGGGILVVPAGEYFTGPLELCAELELHLERGSRLVFSDNFSDYRQDGDEVQSLLSARNCHDIALSGEGTIDGNGNAWWERVREARAKDPIKHDDAAPRPHLIVFKHCQRVRLSGVTLTRSPMFHFVPSLCEEVTVEGIAIVSPPHSPNTDGIDPSQTKRMLIANCKIDTGDDCIAFKAGGSGGPFVEDVLVLDEPTNDLDLASLRMLEEALADFDGSVLVVSHDRYFLDRICDQIVAFEDTGAFVQPGNYSYYLEKRREREALAEAARPKPLEPVTSRLQPASPARPPRPRKLGFKEQRELDAMEAAILAAEQRVQELETTLNDPEFHATRSREARQLIADLEAARAEAARLYDRWQELAGE